MLTCLQIVLMDELIVCKPCGITFFPWAQRGLAPLRPQVIIINNGNQKSVLDYFPGRFFGICVW